MKINILKHSYREEKQSHYQNLTFAIYEVMLSIRMLFLWFNNATVLMFGRFCVHHQMIKYMGILSGLLESQTGLQKSANVEGTDEELFSSEEYPATTITINHPLFAATFLNSFCKLKTIYYEEQPNFLSYEILNCKSCVK